MYTAFVNEVNEKEANEALHVLASSLMIDPSSYEKDELEEKGIFISFFSRLLEKVMEKDVIKSKEDRLKIIKFLDQLKQQKTSVAFAKGNKVNFEIAAERLGRKAQSSFGATVERKMRTKKINQA